MSVDDCNTPTSARHPRPVEEGESWWSHLTDANVITSLPQPRLGKTEYIEIPFNNQIVHVEGLVDSRSGIPHTHEQVRRFPRAWFQAAGR